MKLNSSDLNPRMLAPLYEVAKAAEVYVNGPSDSAHDRLCGALSSLEAFGARERRNKAERAGQAHVVKRGCWGLVVIDGDGRPRWSRGYGNLWLLADAERYAKAFGGTVRR